LAFKVSGDNFFKKYYTEKDIKRAKKKQED
jgi:hypothetical protein